MTSSGSWPLLRKYENGKEKKRGGEKKGLRLRYLTRERLACWGGGGERDRADENWRNRDVFEARNGGFLAARSRGCSGAPERIRRRTRPRRARATLREKKTQKPVFFFSQRHGLNPGAISIAVT